MHMNVRCSANVVVFNSYNDNEWKNEERIPNPMRCNDKFLIRFIIREKDIYIEFIEYNVIYEFAHRLPVDDIFGFSIEEEVKIYYIFVQNYSLRWTYAFQEEMESKMSFKTIKNEEIKIVII